MKYTEIHGDLFNTKCKYLAHCISADYSLGAGIAVIFNKKFKIGRKLMQVGTHKYPETILTDNVFNLVTKKCYWMKPTIKTVEMALIDMRRIALENNIKEIAMPQIGSGLDKLAWGTVSEKIKEVFKDTDISIFVYIFK